MPNSRRAVGALALVVSLAGCSAGWINDPSPSTVNLVNDLKLEGFACNAGFSSVTCRQVEPYIERSSLLCSSDTGCLKQVCYDVRLVYEIRQMGDGIPTISQSTERKVTKELPTGNALSEARRQELTEYCAL